MVRVNEKEFAEKWARRLKGATEDIRRGVEKLDRNPAEEAIKKKEKMKARLIEAIDSGRWEAGLKKVTLEEWKAKMLNKGIGRIPAGVDEATPKMEEFARVLLPHIEEGVKKIEGMPDLTLEDNIRRMEEFIRHMAKLKYKK